MREKICPPLPPPLTKIPKLSVVDPAVLQDHAQGNSSFLNHLSPYLAHISPQIFPNLCSFLKITNDLTPQSNSCLFSFSGSNHGPTHSMSDNEDDQPPGLLDNNSLQAPDDIGEGTTTDFHFTGGFGRGGAPPVLEPEPSFLGVGNSDFYQSGQNEVEIYEGEGGDYAESAEDSDYEDSDLEDESGMFGPSPYDLEVDDLGTITHSPDQSEQKFSHPSIPTVSMTPTVPFAIPSAEQLQQLLAILNNKKSQGQQAPSLMSTQTGPQSSQALPTPPPVHTGPPTGPVATISSQGGPSVTSPMGPVAATSRGLSPQLPRGTPYRGPPYTSYSPTT